MSTHKEREALAFDPCVKLAFVVMMSAFTFIAKNNITLTFFLLVALYFPLKSGKYRSACMTGALYLIVLGFDALITRYVSNAMLKVGLGMFTDVAERLVPTFVIAMWAIDTTETSLLIPALQRMHIPKGFVISLTVVFRFIPTVRYEFWYIRSAMKLRGIGLSWKRFFRHPVKMMEYGLVPLLMRSMKIAEDLAASALTRGLDRENERTSLRDVRLRPYDLVGSMVFVAIIVAGLQFDRLF